MNGEKTTCVRYTIVKSDLPALLGIEVPEGVRVSVDVTREELSIVLTTVERISE